MKIDHVAIAVESIDKALEFYRDSLGLELERIEEVEEQGVRAAFLVCGESRIELLEPLREDSPVGKFLRKAGEGIHHIAISTGEVILEEKLRDLDDKGVELIDRSPKIGAHGKKIAFIHPRSTSRVLLELCSSET